jgi:hypothetical protein
LRGWQAYGYAFTFTGDYVVRRSDVQYFDPTGTLVKEVVWAHFVGSDTNDLTGKSLRDTGERHIMREQRRTRPHRRSAAGAGRP